MYWIYGTKMYTWRNQYVQAKLVIPPPKDLSSEYGRYGFDNGLQNNPYGAPLRLTYQVNPHHPHPDNYAENTSFTLFSQRLVELFQSYDISSEIFPVTMTDMEGKVIHALKYYVYHNLEGLRNAMDEDQSDWMGDWHIGVPKLVIKEKGFEQRPIFTCNKIYVPLMRDDLKQEIQRLSLTGFAFLAPERYRSGKYGFPPDFE